MLICTCQQLFKECEGETEGKVYHCDICNKDFCLPPASAEKADKMSFMIKKEGDAAAAEE